MVIGDSSGGAFRNQDGKSQTTYPTGLGWDGWWKDACRVQLAALLWMNAHIPSHISAGRDVFLYAGDEQPAGIFDGTVGSERAAPGIGGDPRGASLWLGGDRPASAAPALPVDHAGERWGLFGALADHQGEILAVLRGRGRRRDVGESLAAVEVGARVLAAAILGAPGSG